MKLRAVADEGARRYGGSLRGLRTIHGRIRQIAAKLEDTDAWDAAKPLNEAFDLIADAIAELELFDEPESE